MLQLVYFPKEKIQHSCGHLYKIPVDSAEYNTITQDLIY